MFTWPSKLGNDGKWKVELDGDNVYLKNVAYGRYLYSPNDCKGFQFDSNRRYVFTWPSMLSNDKFKWKIEDCGYARKKHDMQELDSKVSLGSDFLEAMRARNKLNGTKILALSGRLEDGNLLDGPDQTREIVSQTVNNKEKPLQRNRRHYLSRKTLAIDSSNQPEIVASSGTRRFSWMNSCIFWAKNLAASTFSIISALPAQYNIVDKNNVESDNKNIPQSIALFTIVQTDHNTLLAYI